MVKHVSESRMCKRGCCWTPFSCGKTYSCRCHASREPNHYDARLRLEDMIDALGDDE